MAEPEQSVTSPGSDWPSRAEVALRLGISETSVRRHLASTPDADGKHRISPEEVERYAEANGISLRAPDNANAMTDAGVAAAVYAEFEAGQTDSAIVQKLILEPKVVRELRREWHEGNGLETRSGVELVEAFQEEFRRGLNTLSSENQKRCDEIRNVQNYAARTDQNLANAMLTRRS